MRKTLLWLAAAALFGAPQTGQACFSYTDQFAAGILWNNGEGVDYTRLEMLGTANQHYVKEKIDSLIIYKYRSHSDPRHAMVQLGWYRAAVNDVFPQVIVLLDTLQDRTAFDFAQAVGVELAWLAGNGVLGDMSSAARQEAVDSLAAAGGGNAQYWTLQRRVLPYNAFFIYNAATGTWEEMGAFRNGCGAEAVFELPPEELGGVTISDYERIAGFFTAYQVEPNPFRGTVMFTCQEPAVVGIYQASGEVVRTFKLGSRPYQWDGRDQRGRLLPAGIYYCRCTVGQAVFTHAILKY